MGLGTPRTCQEYTDSYRVAIQDANSPTASLLVDGMFAMRNEQLVVEGKPLNPNNRLLYETLCQLQPKSISEFGCGCAHNLYNLAKLMPNTLLSGVEWCQEMIDLGYELFPNLKAQIVKEDISRQFDAGMFDVAFSHIVLMHLDGMCQWRAIQTMMESARWQVVMLENWSVCDFGASIQYLFGIGISGWNTLYLYTRPSPELGRKHILIASKIELDYEPLINYEMELAKPVRDNWQTDYLRIGNREWINA